jgi:hypothetical protein
MPLVGANYRMKVPPCYFTARHINGMEWLETKEESTSLEQILFSGFGFCLIEREVLEATKAPRFLQEWNKDKSVYTTEDLPFFRQAYEAGYPAYIDHKVSKRVYHVGNWYFSYDNDFPEVLKHPAAERAKK